jgi:hypothetical protein
MKFVYEQQQLPLVGGVVQAQRLVIPPEVVMRIAWKLRNPRITQRTFAELTGCYPPHVSDYFSVHPKRRELPAGKAGIACAVLGNTVLIQYLAQDCRVTVLEELQASRRAA